MNGAGAIKSAFFTIWLLLVVAVTAALYQQDRFFAIDRRPIADLTEKSGNVSFRSEDLVRWQDAEVNHGFFDGDRVATGKNSTSKIHFGTGRDVLMGEDTQVQITAIQQSSNENAYLITLVRGSVVADVADSCKRCLPLVVRAGGETFNISTGKKIGVFKAVGKKVRKFDPKGPMPVARPLVVAGVQPSPSSEPPKPSPLPILKADAAKGFEAEINPLGAGSSATSPRVWWTLKSLSSMSGVAIEFPVIKPSEMPKVGRWRPFAEISGADGHSGKQVVLASGTQNDSISIPIEKIRRAASVNRYGAAREYVFKLRGGAEVFEVTPSGKKKAESRALGSNTVEFKIRSFGEVGGGAVVLGIDQLTGGSTSGLWLEPKNELKVESAPISILMASGSDLSRFHSYMRGAGALGLSGGGSFTGQGIFVVRNQIITAQLFGSGVNDDSINKIMTSLGGDFVFKGARAALNDSRGKSQADLLQWIGSLLDKGKVLYIMKRNKLYPVSRDFIKTNSEVAQFIDSQAKAIFLEKVEILDYR